MRRESQKWMYAANVCCVGVVGVDPWSRGCQNAGAYLIVLTCGGFFLRPRAEHKQINIA